MILYLIIFTLVAVLVLGSVMFATLIELRDLRRIVVRDGPPGATGQYPHYTIGADVAREDALDFSDVGPPVADSFIKELKLPKSEARRQKEAWAAFERN